jgi:molybdopterin-guanine dinucleotide biosynthesis protein A
MTRRDDHRPLVCGVLLAGGLSRRMGGGDKCLRPLGGKAILQHIVERVRPQVDAMVLNANGDPARFGGFDLAVTPDVVEGHAGPLAGVLTGMVWAAKHVPDCDWIVTVPTDAPFLPLDLVLRFEEAAAREGADMVCAASGGRNHPVVGLWPVALREDLRRAMMEEDIRKVDVWTARYKLAVVDWPAEPVDPFFNTNKPEDLETAERLLG